MKEVEESLLEKINRVRQNSLVGAGTRRRRLHVVKWLDIDRLNNRDPELIAAVMPWVERVLKPYFRAEVRGVGRVPAGPGLFVGNHSYGIPLPDSFLLMAALHQTYGLDDTPFALGHDAIFILPALHHIAVRMGVVRASHQNAARLFAAGRKVLVYPGGDVDAMRPWRKRNKIEFDCRRGYISQALLADVPICPVVSAGAQSTLFIIDDLPWLARMLFAPQIFRLHAWPLAISIPWGLTLGPFLAYIPFPSRILVEFLEPIHFERKGEEAASDEAYVCECADHVETVMQTALRRLADEREQTGGVLRR